MSAGVAIAWRPRTEAPLAPLAAIAFGLTARRLAEKLRVQTAEHLAKLRGVAGDDVLLVLGEEAELPWVDGVLYLGRDPIAPSLLLPTALAPTVSPALVERALRSRSLLAGAPMALAVEGAEGARTVLVPAGPALPITRGHLEAWLARAAARAPESSTGTKALAGSEVAGAEASERSSP